MYITFLVGNGFDIASGLDTSYAAFYNWYCNQPSTSPLVGELKKNIINCGENWADFEIGLGKYTSSFRHGMEPDFFGCYEDAHEKMIEYIEGEGNQVDFSSLESEIEQMKIGLLNFYEELSSQERQAIQSVYRRDRTNDTILQFISFNYTNALDRCVSLLAKEPLNEWTANNVVHTFRVSSSVVHVHGTIDEYPILGVNDKSQIACPDLCQVRQFSEVMIKPESIDAIGRFWHEDARKRIADSSIVCVYGMSLGDSDKIWWQNLMHWLANNRNGHLIIYWYAREKQYSRSILKRNSEIDRVKKRIVSFLEATNAFSEFVQERIHVILNTNNVLKISLAKKNFPISEAVHV